MMQAKFRVALFGLLLTTTLATAQPGRSAAASPSEGTRLRLEALGLQGKLDNFGARKIMLLAIAAFEKEYGREDMRLIEPLRNLVSLHSSVGDAPEEEHILERLVSLFEKAAKPLKASDAEAYAQTLSHLALCYSRHGDFAHSEPVFAKAMAVYKDLYGPDSAELSRALSAQATSFMAARDYPRAQQFFQQAHDILAKKANDNGMELMGPLMNLAHVSEQRGLYDAAENHYKRLLEIADKRKTPPDQSTVLFLDQLGRLYVKKGRSVEAQPLFARAQTIAEESLQKKEQAVAANVALKPMLLSDIAFLAMHYTMSGQESRKLPLLEKELELNRQLYGADSLAASTSELQLGEFLRKKGDLNRARTLLQHSLKVQAKVVGEDLATTPRNYLASIEYDFGHFAEARSLYERSRQGFFKRLGKNCNICSYLQIKEAWLWTLQKKPNQALASTAESIERSEALLPLLLSSGTESDKRLALASVAHEGQTAQLLHALYMPKDARALDLAFATVLRRKGRVIDAFGAGILAMRRRLDPSGQTALDKLATARAMLARLVLNPPANPTSEYLEHIAELEQQIRALEESLFTQSPDLRAQAAPVNLESVRVALPAESVLVEFSTLSPIDWRKSDLKSDAAARRYVAYILPQKGPPSFVDLGLQSDLDSQIGRLREALSTSTRSDVKELARAVDEKLMRPLRPLLAQAKHIFLSPDGALNLVPFGALLDEEGHFLVQRYTMTYLTSGRDLLRLHAALLPRSKSTIIANPAFGEPLKANELPAQNDAQARGRRSAEMRLSTSWGPLPGTAEEAEKVSALLPNSSVLLQAAATETSVKQLSGPSILHIATHGFFLPAPDDNDEEQSAENPLLRSGLLFSGANRRESGMEDGVLTALEASGLDLGGTELVVLSACETGLGKVQSGDGVYGLRRALVLSGAQTQVMSLWQVDDNATRDLMVAFYKRLRSGKGRGEALRQAQLKLLGTTETQHPYFWASFLTAGDWQPLHTGAMPKGDATPAAPAH